MFLIFALIFFCSSLHEASYLMKMHFIPYLILFFYNDSLSNSRASEELHKV